jgi:hypothetical protein
MENQMNTQRLAIGLTVLNLGLLSCSLVPSTTAQTQDVIRTSRLEIVDERGVVRGRFGFKGADTVELDMFDRSGIIRIKFGAGDDGTGLVMGDGTAPTSIHLLARNTPSAVNPATTHITLKGPAGRENVIRP